MQKKTAYSKGSNEITKAVYTFERTRIKIFKC